MTQTIDITPAKEEQSLTIRREQALASPLDMEPAAFQAGLDRRKANRQSLMEWIRSALVEGTDYGRIPTKRGPSKPSLWKPGAEKICGMLGVTTTFPTLSEYEQAALNGTEIKSIVLRCEITNASGCIIGIGIGARSLAQDYGDLNKALKMAEKSAHIDATLRMAGLSEIFTQDLEDMPPKGEPERGKVQTPSPSKQNASEVKPERKVATETTKKWALGEIGAFEGARDLVTEFFVKADALLPTESVEELPLQFVPTSKAELALLKTAITEFGNGAEAHMPYKHDLVLAPEKKPIEVPRDPDAGKQEEAERAIDPDWQMVTGKVAKVSYKSGTKKNGEQWELFGIKIGDDWFNTFSSRIGHFAQTAEKSGGEVTVYYSEGEKGLNAEEIE